MSNDLKLLAAKAALDKMFKDGYFSISTIDRIADMLSVHVKGETYSMLHTLHCVHYKDMDPYLLEQLPMLIMKVFGSSRFDSNNFNIVTSGTSLKLVGSH